MTEIIPGTLHALGGWLRMEERPVSWIPPAARGWIPVQGYALRSADDWLMVDTGLPVHWPLVAEGIAHTIGGAMRRLITTRREQDCMNNLPRIVRDFDVREVLYAGVLNPLDFFEDLEDRNAEAQVAAATGLTATRIAPGVAVEVGALRLEILRVELRLLATNWFYEVTTRTLFTSDAFAFLTRPAPDMPRVRAPNEAPIRTEDAASFLSAKMDWLIGIDPAPVIADLDAIQAARPIARICPGFGLIIEGEDAVRDAFDATREAVRILGARRRAPWRWPDGLVIP